MENKDSFQVKLGNDFGQVNTMMVKKKPTTNSARTQTYTNVCTDAPAKNFTQVSKDATTKQVETKLLQTLMELKFNKGGERERCSGKMEANERYAHECINTHKRTLKHQRKCQQVIA